MTRYSPLAILIVSLGLAACGGDDDSGSAPTKQEFANKADKICRDAEKDLETINEGNGTPQEVVDAIDQGIAKSREAANQLAALDRPEGSDGETATEFVEGFKSELNEELVPALKDLQDALRQRDPAAVKEAADKLGNLEPSKSDAAARELGATGCFGGS
jgi:hypothetical protein